MSSASGKHSEQRMSQKTEAARVVAKLLSKRRHTSINEIPEIIENVERALQSLDSNASKSIKKEPRATEAKTVAEPRAKRAAGPRKRDDAHVVAPAAEKVTAEKIAVEKIAAPEKPVAEGDEPLLHGADDLLSSCRRDAAPIRNRRVSRTQQDALEQALVCLRPQRHAVVVLEGHDRGARGETHAAVGGDRTVAAQLELALNGADGLCVRGVVWPGWRGMSGAYPRGPARA